MREESSEEENVIYYVRGENIIEKMDLMNKPFYEQVSIFSYINYKYIKSVVEALVQKRTDDAKTPHFFGVGAVCECFCDLPCG